ncbi:MAG: DUF1990 family protein [Nocardioidaceae bacterium]|nr:DUF1990 family protein [Nocardioidaceae bacterium]
MWMTTPLHRSEEPGGAEDLPDPVPDQYVDDTFKPVTDGVGPLLHRRFSVRIRESDRTPEDVMEQVMDNLNVAVPSEVAFFRKTKGANGPVRVGDEYVVRMPGPWDGPVRVIHQDATSFRFATLAGHLEAGQIEFRISRDDNLLKFEIETWARAGDRLSHLLYSVLRVSKEVQLNMWLHFCLSAAALSGGRPHEGVTIRTRTIHESYVYSA